MPMGTCGRRIVIIGALLAMACQVRAQSDLFRCKQADGSTKFSDHGGLGCRKGDYKADVQHVERELSPLEPATAASSPADAGSAASPRAGPGRSFQPFPAATRSVPSLAVRDLPPHVKAKGLSIPNKGDITIVQLAVSHLPAGNGPKFSSDNHFRGEARYALETAAYAAAGAVQYDPKYLAVELTLPVGFRTMLGVQVDGPSAGAAWTVAIVSAVLGDPLRSDVCFSGTMGPDLKVGPVGGLEHKIEGCHMMREFRELLLPAGQNTFTITDKGMARSIKVTEVATLAEAYQIMTGRELRPFQQ
jgi:Lon protease-like protein